jgi:predicted  nucleic acid-binding Zn-ribbon protein
VASKRQHARDLLEASYQEDRRWEVEYNQALRELLEHIAEELAHEYVRLMKTPKSGSGDPK